MELFTVSCFCVAHGSLSDLPLHQGTLAMLPMSPSWWIFSMWSGWRLVCVFHSSAEFHSALEEAPLRHTSSSLSCWLSSFVPDISSMCVSRFLFCCVYRDGKRISTFAQHRDDISKLLFALVLSFTREVKKCFKIVSSWPALNLHKYIYIYTPTYTR